ncbi:hypothetical protein [Flavobacterium sp.]|uniref:hypothetical protein n=1 Tax=Flavobacterium sp. TaxID=239 RepID=UPI0026334D52|nr:hypothetical protein [Flavobacterium sp.]
MKLEERIKAIKKIINDNEDIDGDFWHYEGDELIHQILDTFIENEWQSFIKELDNFTDYERYQFTTTLLNYDNDRIVKIVDIYEIYFNQYLLLNLEDADWLIQDLMYVENIRQPSINLLKNLHYKINQLRKYDKTVWKEDQFAQAENTINQVIEKHYR